MAEASSSPQSHSSELSTQSASPSHHRSRDTHSWFAHSSSSAWQNAGRGTRREDINILGMEGIFTNRHLTVCQQAHQRRRRCGCWGLPVRVNTEEQSCYDLISEMAIHTNSKHLNSTTISKWLNSLVRTTGLEKWYAEQQKSQDESTELKSEGAWAEPWAWADWSHSRTRPALSKFMASFIFFFNL